MNENTENNNRKKNNFASLKIKNIVFRGKRLVAYHYELLSDLRICHRNSNFQGSITNVFSRHRSAVELTRLRLCHSNRK